MFQILILIFFHSYHKCTNLTGKSSSCSKFTALLTVSAITSDWGSADEAFSPETFAEGEEAQAVKQSARTRAQESKILFIFTPKLSDFVF